MGLLDTAITYNNIRTFQTEKEARAYLENKAKQGKNFKVSVKKVPTKSKMAGVILGAALTLTTCVAMPRQDLSTGFKADAPPPTPIEYIVVQELIDQNQDKFDILEVEELEKQNDLSYGEFVSEMRPQQNRLGNLIERMTNPRGMRSMEELGAYGNFIGSGKIDATEIDSVDGVENNESKVIADSGSGIGLRHVVVPSVGEKLANHIVSDILSVTEGTRDFATYGRADTLNVGREQLNVLPQAQTLNDAMVYMFANHRELSKQILGNSFPVLLDVFTRRANETQQQYGQRVNAFFLNRENFNNHYAVIAQLVGNTQQGIEFQISQINRRIGQAQSLTDMHGLSSMRSMAYIYDKVVQFGRGGADTGRWRYHGAHAFLRDATRNLPRNADRTINFDHARMSPQNLKPYIQAWFTRTANQRFPGNTQQAQASRQDFVNFQMNFIRDLYRQNPRLVQEYFVLILVDDHLVIHDSRGRGILGAETAIVNGERVRANRVHGRSWGLEFREHERANWIITNDNLLNMDIPRDIQYTFAASRHTDHLRQDQAPTSQPIHISQR